MAELKGRKFHGKKNLLNQFLKEYPDYSFRPATSEDGDLCVALAEKWCRVKVCDRPDFAMELSAVKRSFDAFDGIGLGESSSLSPEFWWASPSTVGKERTW